MSEIRLECVYKYRPLYSYIKNEIYEKTGVEIQRNVNQPVLNDNTLKILTQGELFFNSPNKYEDSFDSYTNIDLNLINEREQLLQKRQVTFSSSSIKFDNENISIKELLNITDKYKNLEIAVKTKIKKNLETLFRGSFLIHCFCDNYSENYMWKKYGDEFSGVCIGFKINNTQNNTPYINFKKNKGLCPIELKKVHYQSDIHRKKIDFNLFEMYSDLDNNSYKIDDCITTKSIKYIKESEYRLVYNIHGPFYQSLFKKSNIANVQQNVINEIIFGKDTPFEAVRLTLIEIKKANFINIYKVKFYKMRYKPKSNELDREEINIKDYLV